MDKLLRLVIILCVCIIGHSFRWTPKDTGSGDIPDKLFAGEVHYSRIPVEYWEHRIRMIKALGLNALSVYIMWNYHEVERGKFDYSTSNKNLTRFLQLAKQYDMKVLIRPGPYVCAEWDLGGFPARLLGIKGIVFRDDNQIYLDQVQIYFSSLAPILKPYLRNADNPQGIIVMLQIENEYGFYSKNKAYIEALRKMWADLAVKCEQYYVDVVENILKCHWTGANIGINNGITQIQYEYARTFEWRGYLFGGEIYSGWLTHWYEDWQQKSIAYNEKQYGFLMEKKHSYSMYMAHGGSNFGLTAGGNSFIGKKFNYRGHVTSYDYDAPINQQGSAATKYTPLRELIMKYVAWEVPDVPEPIPTISIEKFVLSVVGSLNANTNTPFISGSKTLPVFESQELKMYNQGIVVYETVLKEGKYYLQAIAHDFAVVYLDNAYIACIDRSLENKSNFMANCSNDQCQLRIQVEAMGHINFGHQMHNDFKGLINITDTEGRLFTWNIYRVPVDSAVFNWDKTDSQLNSTTLLKASLSLDRTGDTYFDMKQLTKGYLWVNGHNLGRYWAVGPQKRLFCPGVWLAEGLNTIHVLELLYDQTSKYIEGKQTLK